MGQETVAETASEGKLADYYLAALEYIDPALTPDSSLDDVEIAAVRRRDILARAPRAEIQEELGALSEALQFIQRVHTANKIASAGPAAPGATAAIAEPAVPQEPPADQLVETKAEADITEAPGGESIQDSFQQSLFDSDTQAPPASAKPRQAAIPLEPAVKLESPPIETPEPQPVAKQVFQTPVQPLDDPEPAASTAQDVHPAHKAKPAAASAPSKPDLTAPLRLPKAEELSEPPAEQPAATDPKSTDDEAAQAPEPAQAKPAKRPAAESQRRISRAPGKRNGQSLREVMAQAQLEAAGLLVKATHSGQLAAATLKNRRAADHPLPEAQAWPVIVGMALIGWQVWLAAYAGWTVTRFFTWPAPDYGYLISRSQAVLLIVVAIIMILLVAKITWSYRRQTRRLLLLAHLSAVLIGMDLLAWWLAALDPNKLIPAPAYWYWVALVIGWLAGSAACWLYDLRASRHAPE